MPLDAGNVLGIEKTTKRVILSVRLSHSVDMAIFRVLDDCRGGRECDVQSTFENDMDCQQGGAVHSWRGR